MKNWSNIKRGCLGVLVGWAAFATVPALADWPDRPIKIIVTSPPGGAPDFLARLVGEQLSRNLKQPVIVESKPGASGAIAVQAMLSAPADGLTLVVAPSAVLTEVPHVVKVGFDPLKDIKQVAELASSSLVMVATATLPPNTLQEFITYAKARPGELSFASYSSGTRSHFAGLVLNQKAGIDMSHVPYKGSPQAAPDLLGGQIPLMFDSLPNALKYIKSGKLKAYAVASPKRSQNLLQTPTFIELGFPDVNFGGWTGIYASAKTSPQLMAAMHDEIQKALTSPEIRQRIIDAGFELSPTSRLDQQDAMIRTEFERNALIVKTFNIRAD